MRLNKRYIYHSRPFQQAAILSAQEYRFQSLPKAHNDLCNERKMWIEHYQSYQRTARAR